MLFTIDLKWRCTNRRRYIQWVGTYPYEKLRLNGRDTEPINSIILDLYAF